MDKKLSVRELWEKYKETILYVVFGGLTTLLNLVTFYVLFQWLGVDKVPANIAAWIVGVLFAFFTNKSFVFGSKDWSLKNFLWEFLTFMGARLFSLLFDTVFLLFFTEWVFRFDPMIIKIISNIFVIIINYVLSKLIVFRNTRKKTEEASESGDGR